MRLWTVRLLSGLVGAGIALSAAMPPAFAQKFVGDPCGQFCGNGLVCVNGTCQFPGNPGGNPGQQPQLQLQACIAGCLVQCGIDPAANAACAACIAVCHNNLLRPKGDLRLLQPLDDRTFFISKNLQGIDIVFYYFNLGWPWLLGTAAGFAVLQAVIGGVQIMLSGDDGGKREAGISRFTWAAAGLLMLGLAGFILRTLNPMFFR